MKQRISTIMCIALLALQLNTWVTAEETRTVSDGDLAVAIENGDIVIAEGTIEEDVFVFDEETIAGEREASEEELSADGAIDETPAAAVDLIAPAGDVTDGDVTGEDETEDVSDGDLNAEDEATEDVSGGDLPPEDVSDGDAQGDDTEQDVSGGDLPGEDVADNDPQDEEDGDGLSDEDASGGDIPDEELPEEDVSDGDIEDAIDLSPLAVVRMVVPRNLDFVIDPMEICEKGTVWSREYAFRNSGRTAVCLKLSNIRCSARDGISCVGQSVDGESVLKSSDKMIKLQLALSNGDVIDITEDGSAYEVVIKPGSTLTLTVTGASSNPEIDKWKSGDVSLSMVYRAEICKK